MGRDVAILLKVMTEKLQKNSGNKTTPFLQSQKRMKAADKPAGTIERSDAYGAISGVFRSKNVFRRFFHQAVKLHLDRGIVTNEIKQLL